MLRPLEPIVGYDIDGIEETIGKVADFYFDDATWDIRYVVVDTGSWLIDRKVILSPEAFDEPDWRSEKMPTSLSKKEIEESPGIDADKPVSREKEIDIFKFFRWAPYWNATNASGIYAAATTPPVVNESDSNTAENDEAKTNIRSFEEVRNYLAHTIKDDAGKVRDFIIDDNNWKIRFLVIDIGSLLKSREILVPVKFVTSIDWHKAAIELALDKATLEQVPEYDDNEMITNEYEERIKPFYDNVKSSDK
jgi:hypothetical protein